MKVAFASNDGTTLAEHFHGASGFVVVDVADGKVVSREHRSVAACAGQGECRHGGDPHHDHPAGHGQLLKTLAGVDVVVCGGMGDRAAGELEAGGIRAVIAAEPALPMEQMVAQLAQGTLRIKTPHRCCCGGGQHGH